MDTVYHVVERCRKSLSFIFLVLAVVLTLVAWATGLLEALGGAIGRSVGESLEWLFML